MPPPPKATKLTKPAVLKQMRSQSETAGAQQEPIPTEMSAQESDRKMKPKKKTKSKMEKTVEM